jgi:CRP/FNR family transcriptional regulator, cyclic AMP receptor protein
MSDLRSASPELRLALKKTSLFQGLSDAVLENIVQRLEAITAARGKLLMVNGDTTTDAYLLIRGRVIGQLVAENGREILFTEIAQGGYFGEIAALDGAARSITISASTDCVLAKIPRQCFLELLQTHPQLGINLAKNLAARLREMNERVFGLVMHDVETRVRIRLMQLAQTQEQLTNGGIITDTPTHEGMANFIGANREAVSRAFAKLIKSGVIATARKQVEIKNLDGLMSPIT